MAEVVGVRFRKAGKIYFFDPSGIALKTGDYVVVATGRGQETGQVVVAPSPDDAVALVRHVLNVVVR